MIYQKKSEEIFGLELGSRGQTKALAYELSFFAYKKDNVIFRDSDFFNVEGGQTTHRGVELSLDYHVVENLMLGLRGSYAAHKYDNRRNSGGINISGNEIDSAPRHFGTVFLRKYFAQRGQIELEWVHQSRYYTDPENQHRYAGHDYANLRAQWQYAGQWSGGLRIINITGVQYADRADYTGFSGDRYFPAAQRAAFIDLQYQWH